MKRCIIELAISTFLIILAVDLLYLYYMGAWFSPPSVTMSPSILAELISLWSLIALGVGYAIWRFRKQWKGD